MAILLKLLKLWNSVKEFWAAVLDWSWVNHIGKLELTTVVTCLPSHLSSPTTCDAVISPLFLPHFGFLHVSFFAIMCK